MRKITERTRERIVRLLKLLSEEDAKTILFFIEKVLESRAGEKAAKKFQAKAPAYPAS